MEKSSPQAMSWMPTFQFMHLSHKRNQLACQPTKLEFEINFYRPEYIFSDKINVEKDFLIYKSKKTYNFQNCE